MNTSGVQALHCRVLSGDSIASLVLQPIGLSAMYCLLSQWHITHNITHKACSKGAIMLITQFGCPVFGDRVVTQQVGCSLWMHPACANAYALRQMMGKLCLQCHALGPVSHLSCP